MVRVIDNSTGEEFTGHLGGSRRKKTPGDVPGRCNHKWGEEPKFPVPGAHYRHWCGLLPGHRSKHVCMTTPDCGEME
jgi:hypothetical protein